MTVPVLCMGLFALPVARLLRRTDVRTATGWCLATIAIATVLRPLSPGFSAMVALTFVFGVGSGVVGALLPVVVKERFAERPALGTGVFALGLNVGATLGAGLAVPLALATDSWRWSLGLLALAGALAVPAWVRLSRYSLGRRPSGRDRRPPAVAQRLRLVGDPRVRVPGALLLRPQRVARRRADRGRLARGTAPARSSRCST